ncbi:arylsulfatase [Flavihumibacter petaseus]|uniref:Putative arylsulfatase n=1 Tax=Flavihumibacter petaseus NBRC 106054 TaxID=1220578 RepID=A0A0E9N064_9BACT|nr:arylsulfatase [Flavihumibacter petaseus]GAO42760.1 putative arylsulfatase [Flavihumibacter petaseus NBRC 106054]
MRKALYFLTLFTGAQLCAAIAMAQQKPNIIYIYADDLGIGEIGPYGQKKIKTPNLDRLAKEGMRFTQHYSGAPVCAPSRCMLMTGKHGGHSYVRGNYEMGGFRDETEGGQMPLPYGTFTIAKLMKQAGYTTGASGKWGLGITGSAGAPNKQGFDYFYGLLDQKQAHNFYPTHLWENDHKDSLRNPFIDVHRKVDSTHFTQADFDYYKGKDYAIDKMTEHALAFLDKNKSRRFFLYVPFTLPHLSLQVPDAWVEKYKGQFPESPYYSTEGYAAVQYPKSTYAAMISYLDQQVGILMEKIKAMGLDNNTIIMFSSDNGATFLKHPGTEYFDSHMGLRGYKMDLYEGGIRAPFIVRWPGKVKAGSESALISAQFDMMATLAELTGQSLATGTTDGISFLPELLGQPGRQQKHEYLYFEYPENGGQVAIRYGNWKGVRTGLLKDPKAPWQLFDLGTDPAETSNVAAAHPDIIARFDQWQRASHEHPQIREWEIIDPKFERGK